MNTMHLFAGAGGGLLADLILGHTPVIAVEWDKTDGSPVCKCGRETFGCSIHPNTRDEFIASMVDSLVRTLAALEIKQASAKAREADFTGKCSESLMWYDPDTCSWKMSLPSSKKSGYKLSSKTLPRSGMMLDGHVYLHRQPVPRTTVIVGGVLQNEVTATSGKVKMGSNFPMRMWPTPTQRDYKSGHFLPEAKEKRMCCLKGKPLSEILGGLVNPTWIEWMMGWPIGWTVSKPSATAKCPSKRRPHG